MSLRHLFHKPAEKTIADVGFLVYQVGYDQFEDALVVAKWMRDLQGGEFNIEALDLLKKGTPERAAVDLVVSGCLALANDPERITGAAPDRLQPGDLADMPAAMLAEAITVVLEANMDFFFRTLQRMEPTAKRLGTWIGLASLSSLSGPATIPTPSADTPSASSAAI